MHVLMMLETLSMKRQKTTENYTDVWRTNWFLKQKFIIEIVDSDAVFVTTGIFGGKTVVVQRSCL